ncbi:UdgX family uracil-DNA binding protein [Polaromonas sp.]|jgi:DNA polymerase|uniref:UdgX family uracil-DNA binding protein n=1 Tax=Polaromonas sp. TaxID=1869339 RepID=UPI002C3852B5|nr:UdgX family uracil-DNA binding protein [Polaromonas sp.]HQS30387.1 UdgX family uracil-DNA binding protein [Polaromonas sp.]HQS90353.1 UdgX family uracil-DNA binding protein [Polaromonas sp.]
MGVMNELLTDDLFLTAEQHGAGRQQSVMLQGAVDWPGFRRAARRLLAQQVAPECVSWHCSSTPVQDLFAAHSLAPPETPHETIGLPASDAPAVNVPPEFLTLCQSVILHSDPHRFGLLYRLLWRLVQEPGLRHDPLDADRVRADQLAQAVRRDMHKMKAFVRFTSAQDETFRSQPTGGPLHVAWFEPEHHIIEATAPFFARRFTQMRWAILTPECSIRWDGSKIDIGPGASKADAPPADAGEQLWLTYYQHIFNPARLKLKMMQKEMPRKYWKNLPEAQFISALTAQSAQRQMAMIGQAPSTPRRRIPVFRDGRAATERAQTALALDQVQGGEKPLDLATLNLAAQRCRACPIGQHATQAVCGEGPAHARVMVVGEQPGDQEDLRGRPLIGPAGQLFDRALADLGWPRSSLFITNAVKHFKYEPRGKRRLHKTPSQLEASACLHWLESEIDLVRPEVVIALGATAAASLLGRHVAVMSERGQWFARADGLRVLVTLHPAALLRTPPEHQPTAYAAWLKDLAAAAAWLAPQSA